MTTSEFEKLVEQALAPIPTSFRLCDGTPLTERTSEFAELPDLIIMYRLPLREGRLAELGWG
jgi:predicted Zn-dependent protease with MMP-like domain